MKGSRQGLVKGILIQLAVRGQPQNKAVPVFVPDSNGSMLGFT